MASREDTRGVGREEWNMRSQPLLMARNVKRFSPSDLVKGQRFSNESQPHDLTDSPSK